MGINFAIAIIWMLLQRELSLVNFTIGYLLGFALLWLFKPVLGSDDYVRRSFGLIAYAGIFTKAFLSSCWVIARDALTAKMEPLQPRLITYDVTGLSAIEILLLSQSISLTPGTTTVEISEDFSTFVLHVFNTQSPDEVRRQIDSTLKRGILGFTR
jgi:multisubunit Na+/H+ antiporter MnhE subunit